MIPKIIHYCWFGGNPLPDDAQKCIASWKKFFPDYEIKEWNESNFDLNCCNYVKEAYQAKRWAFVSDYARFWILYNYGGLYFDTDVEVIKSFDTILARGPFMGCEIDRFVEGSHLGANAGLGLGVAAGLGLYKEILIDYNASHFILNDGSQNLETVVVRITNILKKHGFQGNGNIEQVAGITIYPPEYFCPYNFDTDTLTITENTVSIHHYSASWFTKLDKLVHRIETCKTSDLKEYKIRHAISLPVRIINKFYKTGFRSTIKTVKKNLFKRNETN